MYFEMTVLYCFNFFLTAMLIDLHGMVCELSCFLFQSLNEDVFAQVVH